MPRLAGQSRDCPLGRARSGATEGTEAELRRAFPDAYVALENRIKLFVVLPIEKLDRLAIKRNVDDIGRGAAPRLELP